MDGASDHLGHDKAHAALQVKRIAVFKAFASDVATGGCPDACHQVWMDASEHDRFLKQVQTV